jgi:type I restriction-modification system DNA methylase subunit
MKTSNSIEPLYRKRSRKATRFLFDDDFAKPMDKARSKAKTKMENPLAEPKQTFLSVIQKLGQRYSTNQVFEDFVQFASIELSQTARMTVGLPKHEKDEQSYLDIVKRYKPEELKDDFVQLMASTIFGLEEMKDDFLGDIFSILKIGNAAMGQFFTPYHICRFISEAVIGEDGIKQSIEQRGYVTVNEPSCGSGGMVIAYADSFRKAGYDTATQMFAIAQDLSSTCAAMCHIQLSLLGIPAIVLNMDSLAQSQEPYWFRYTPVYYWMGWQSESNRRT